MSKSNLDEMQEQKMLRIEHNTCWLAFWGLVLAILVQAMLAAPFADLLGELAVLLALCGYMVTDCLRQGIWDRKLTPDPKTNFLGSLAAGAVVAPVMWVILARLELEPGIHLAISGGLGLVTFALCLGALTLCARIYRNKRDQLEKE